VRAHDDDVSLRLGGNPQEHGYGLAFFQTTPLVYQTITGRRIPLAKLSRSEKQFPSQVQQKYHGRLQWTRFAAW
jgi:hypothetical protein